MNSVLPILGGILVIVCIICAFKESKITGLYKSIGVFGRLKAYFALDLTGAGIALFIMGILGKAEAESGIGSRLGMIGLGLLCIAIGLLLYITTYKKCPAPFKKKVILDMVVAGLGICLKVGIFFIGAVWILYRPKEITLEDGRRCFLIDGDVYYGTEKIGEVDPDHPDQVILF